MSEQLSQTELLDKIAESRTNIYKQLRKMTYRQPNSEELAQDLTQDTLLKAVRGISTFRQGCKLDSWIYQIAYTTYVDYFRKKKRRPEIMLSELVGNDRDGDENANEIEALITNHTEDKLIHTMEMDKIDRVIRSVAHLLTECQVQIINLHFEKGLTLEEIKKILDISLGTVKTRYYAALRMIKQAYDR